jgi:uncharacterized integral membrane protein
MLSILLSVCIGLGIGYFATQNTAPVTLQFGEFVLDNVPLYMVAVGSLLAGLLIAWIFSFGRTFSTTFTTFGRGRQVSKVDHNVAALERRVHDLEEDNAQLKFEDSSRPRRSAAA